MLPAASPVRFGAFEVDLRAGELRKNGVKIKLQEQPLQVLVLLLERPGQVVTREELQRQLWSTDTFVDFEHSLNAAVKRLREALGDSADNPRFIETLPRHGYRFIAPVGGIEPSSRRGAGVHRRSIWIAALTVAALAVILLGLNVDRWWQWVSSWVQHATIRSLAALPLENLSGKPEDEYFADGMTEELITALGRIRPLRVISRQSVMRYKGTDKSVPQIAHELDVDGLVQGSVLRVGGRVRITVQLIRAVPEEHLWAESYERDLHDVIALQAQVARDIANQIEAKLTIQEQRQPTRPLNPEAYEAYLKGKSHWYRISPEHLDAALKYFQLSLEKDPNYAPAYAGIANVWMMRGDAGSMAPREAFPKAETYVTKALQLDNSLAEAHIARGNIFDLYYHDWSEAEREFLRGIAHNPNSADGHFFYADFLILRGRTDEWKQEIDCTLKLDPVSPFFQSFYGWHLVYLHRYDEAIVQLDKALAIEPDFSSAHMGLWGAFFRKGMPEEALGEAKKFFAVLGYHEVEAALGRGYAEGGYARAMHLGADALATRSKRSHVPAVRIARLYAHAGDKDEALRWLEKACDEGETPLTHLAVAWDWDILRDDPRFGELLRRMNLPH